MLGLAFATGAQTMVNAQLRNTWPAVLACLYESLDSSSHLQTQSMIQS